ncbi:hypothetical protein I7I53_11211 [Histoplasma capsulatum var. duboisii H88]|uniref:Uncharacterized protein n=1 Tax=Ajellomyces capsulatus (strain H88) TaxID=544711 RepID=A0A8A1L8T8_AJEC8|nr:hypothetical protein I7I53_11211 [Histoplasma capsulatum var. duboisii H88]
MGSSPYSWITCTVCPYPMPHWMTPTARARQKVAPTAAVPYIEAWMLGAVRAVVFCPLPTSDTDGLQSYRKYLPFG